MTVKEQLKVGGCVELSEIQKFYEDSHIFITGGTGFIGNLIIQKLICDCSTLSNIYILIRQKKGKSSEQRLQEIFNNSVFDKMKIKQPKYQEKIKFVVGDCEQPDLGLNESDKKFLAERVNVIFHVAATVKFDEKLKKATIINVRATKDLLLFAKTILNLKALIHVSTAYSNCIRKDIQEKVYSIDMSADRLINIVNTLNDEELSILTEKLKGDWPNTYVYTKAVAEEAVEKYGKGLPVAIVRPSMTISTYKEPGEGWINNFYGPVGITTAVGIGLCHTMLVDSNKIADLVPGDYVANCIIASAWCIATSLSKDSKLIMKQENNVELVKDDNAVVFNYVSSPENPLTWELFTQYTKDFGYKWMTIHVIWFNFTIFVVNYYLFKISAIFLHYIPAYIVDTLQFITGKEPKMVKGYDKLHYFIELFTYFSTQQWNFKNDNTQLLWKNLNSTDRKLFPFSMKEFVWTDYFQEFGKGMRMYLLKDPLETVPAALAKYNKLKYIHYFIVICLSLLLINFAFKIIQILL